ncbi:hypothetical protein [Janibacter melonis]|uniref:hypothetical protein n=1 Tax=Janibacter melonis TaxID=262209 RepID=UPI00177E69AD|nr:hypothetical protein [Janibacter melonis]
MTQDPRREELAAHDERGTRDGETVEVVPTHGPEHDTEVHPHVSKSGERVVLNTIAGEDGTEAVRAQAAALLRVVGEAGGLTQDELTERVHEAMAATGAGDQPTVVARSVAEAIQRGIRSRLVIETDDGAVLGVYDAPADEVERVHPNVTDPAHEDRPFYT